MLQLGMTTVIIYLPQSKIGRVLPRDLRGAMEVLVAMKAYLDGSGDRGTDFLVLTAVAATDYVWAGFEKEWKSILENRDPVAPFVHACDMWTLDKEFAAEKGWDRAKVSKLFWDCFLYAQHLDKTDFCVFTCTVDMEAYRRIRGLELRLPHPYSICSRFCSEMVLKWYLEDFSKNYVQGKLNYYFDRNEKHLAAFDLRRKAAAKAVRKPGLDIRTHWDLVDESIAVDSRKYYPVQLADIISWAHTRRLMRQRHGNGAPLEWAELSKIAEGVLPFRRAEMDNGKLSKLALYSGLMPDSIEEEYGPNWTRPIL